MRQVIRAGLLSLLFTFPAFGEEAELSEGIQKWLKAFKKEVLEEVEALKKRSNPARTLDRTLKLSFMLVPEEKKDHAQSVSVTTPEYGSGIQVNSKGSKLMFRVEGKVTPVEARSALNRFAIMFDERVPLN